MLTLRQVKTALVYTDVERPLQVSDTAAPLQYTEISQGPGIGNISGDFYPFEDNERDKESIESWIKMYPRLKELMMIIRRPYMGGPK